MPQHLFYCLGCDKFTARSRGKGAQYPFHVICWECHETDDFFVVPSEFLRSFEERKAAVRDEEGRTGQGCENGN